MWVGDACVYFIRVFARRVSKANAISYEKKSSLPAPGKTSRSRLYLRTHTYTHTQHTRTSHTGSSHSLSLFCYNIIYIYIYYIILPHAKMNGLRLTAVECNMCICRQRARVYKCVCVCVFAPPVWLRYKNVMCVCVFWYKKGLPSPSWNTMCRRWHVPSAFHSTPLPPQINNGLLSYVFLVLSCICVRNESLKPRIYSLIFIKYRIRLEY